MGQQLARAELQIVYRTLFRRIPTLALAVPFEDIPFKHDRLAYGVYELPVSLVAARLLSQCRSEWRVNDDDSSKHRFALPAGRLWRTEGSPWPRQRQQRGPAGGHRGLLRRQPHFAGRRHLLRTFPDDLKDKAPRIWYEDGAYQVGARASRSCRRRLQRGADAVRRPARAPPAPTSRPGSRNCADDGVDKELAFPNAVLALFHYPDKELRELTFRIYNEYVAELQERSNGHFYGVGLINWWDPEGARRTLDELKSLGLKTFLMPLNPGKDDDGDPIDYGSTAMSRRLGRDRGRRHCRSPTTSARPRRRARASSTASWSA